MQSDQFFPMLVTPENLPGYWPFVREELVKVGLEQDSLYLPEDVFATWRAGQCSVFVLLWGGERQGVAVVKSTSRDNGLPELWVWVLSVNLMQGNPGAAVAFNNWLKELATHVGAPTVGMKSVRRGWERRLAPLGWKPTATEYTLEVNHGS
jgi:hypothetical protein